MVSRGDRRETIFYLSRKFLIEQHIISCYVQAKSEKKKTLIKLKYKWDRTELKSETTPIENMLSSGTCNSTGRKKRSSNEPADSM